MTTESDCDNSQYDKDEDHDNSQSDTMTIPNLMRMKIELFVASPIQMKVDFGLVAMAAITGSTLKVQTSRVKKHVPDEYILL